MSRNIEASIKKITDKGFTKSKAQKALKDCNNNVQQALKLLENQVHQAEKLAKAEELLRQKEQERREKDEMRAIRRAQGLPEDSDEERDIEAAKKEKMRLHPCVVQYGNCKFGKFCHFKYLPGDTCVNYLLGNCIYDIKCRNRHSYEGEDLRKYVKDMQERDLVFEDQRGSYYGVDPKAQGKVVTPAYYGEVCGDSSEAWAAPAPLPSAFDTTEGDEPTYTEPLNRDSVWQEEVFVPTPAPQPFLEKVRAGLEEKLAEKSSFSVSASARKISGASKVTVVGGASPGGVLSAKSRFASISKDKHPCIYQMGSCMFGDRCAHKDQPADVCVFFLNGKCRRSSDECEYRHERGTAGSAMSEETLMRLHGRPAGGASRIADLVTQEVPNPQQFFVPTEAVVGSFDGYQFEIQNETEEMSFYFIKEAFPHIDNVEIMQALRLGGSRDAAVELLLEFDAVDGLDASRIEYQLQEQEALEEIDQAERTERLITLCQLFPKMEVKSIEGALIAADDNFDRAFRKLQCQADNLTQVLSPPSSALEGKPAPSAADKLKLDRLYAMFKDLPREVVEDVYADTGALPLAMDTLRLLAHDLNDITDADRAAVDAMRTYQVAPKSSPVSSNAPAFAVREGVVNMNPSFAVRAGASAHRGDFISDSDFYKQVVASADGTEDWRRLRQEAAMINRARIQCISMAGHAYGTKNGKGARAMADRAKQLGILYERVNILAMHALEAEGKGAGISILDLHGFRKDEALDVLKRRLELCVRRKVRKLRVIMGRGLHSQHGKAVLFPLVVEHLQLVEPFCNLGEISSVQQAHVDVDVLV